MKKYILIITMLCTMALCACMPQYQGKGTRVAVIGDSITAHATTRVQAELNAAGYAYSVLGTPSINMRDARKPLVQAAVATRPDVLVVELGINSARDGWTSGDITDMVRILGDVASVPCVVWVIPDALDHSYYDNQGTSAPTLHGRILQFKASLDKRVGTYPNVHVAYWGDVERTHPEWYNGDGLHHSDAGKRAYGRYVRAQVDALC
jgi:lysophospholipase L1-like esterase